ncbi:PAS domain S-box protein [Planomonospora sp. ID67723]|uniref:PAS domain-containing sensor histidine kinase n=1 Tax=Planomonospora sp. ID67723 TaxID=2738134 RepID=UPI0018C3C22D|nr:PAS domain S-box protein [Planomonospora sp. ID67723]MBG0831232.1 PAS domain S-box protein [Planomonospora sp. ID67723]
MPALDLLAGLTARLLDAPAALVSVADSERQVVVSAVGPAGPKMRRAPLSPPLCERVAVAGGPVVVRDTHADGRLGDDRAVGTLEALACAGFPLHGPDGQVLGALCAIDTEPHDWDRARLELVGDLARLAEDEIASWPAHREALRLWTVLERAPDAFISVDAAGMVSAWNAAAEQLFGWTRNEAVGRSPGELIVPPRLRRRYQEELGRVRERGAPAASGHRVELTVVDRSGREFPVEAALQVDVEHDEPVVHAFLHDISERHADRRELEEKQVFLQALLDSLDTGVVACDSEGRLALFNRALRDIHGVPEKPVDVDAWAGDYHLFAPDGETRLSAEQVPLARAFAGEHVDGQQIMVCAPGRTPRRFVVNSRPIDTPDGHRLGAVAAMHDITDHHRAEVLRTAQHAVAQALAEANSSEQAATDVVAAVGGVLGWCCGEYWQVTADEAAITRIGFWSRPDRDLSAFAGEQRALLPDQGLPGMVRAGRRALWISDLPTDPRDFPRKPEALQAGLHAAIGLPVSSGRQVLGVLLFFSESAEAPDDDLLDLLDGICAHAGRYMERRRAEELALALAATRRQFDQVIAQLNDNVWTAEVMPDGRARPVYVSSQGAGVLGGRVSTDTEGDMIKIIARYLHPDDRDVFAGFCAELASGSPAQLEYRLIGVDGVTRWIWTRGMPRREGERLFVDGISTDVTERHRLAEERERLLAQEQRQVRQLKELDRMKDELVAVVSHELRSPIGAIRGYAEMLLDDPELTGEHRAFTDVIDRKSAHLQSLVDDLLDLARLDAGGVAIEPRPVSLTRLVSQSVDDHRPSAEAKQITVTSELDRHLRVHADPVRLRQVLDNLLSNAVKYTPAGGAVTVAARHTDCDDERPDRDVTVTLTVADTGIGIPPEQYPQLFSRFFRASTAHESGIKGTGLGLAITRAIVTAHGGTITAAPRPGGGTIFTMCLPVNPPPEEDAG